MWYKLKFPGRYKSLSPSDTLFVKTTYLSKYFQGSTWNAGSKEEYVDPFRWLCNLRISTLLPLAPEAEGLLSKSSGFWFLWNWAEFYSHALTEITLTAADKRSFQAE